MTTLTFSQAVKQIKQIVKGNSLLAYEDKQFLYVTPSLVVAIADTFRVALLFDKDSKKPPTGFYPLSDITTKSTPIALDEDTKFLEACKSYFYIEHSYESVYDNEFRQTWEDLNICRKVARIGYQNDWNLGFENRGRFIQVNLTINSNENTNFQVYGINPAALYGHAPKRANYKRQRCRIEALPLDLGYGTFSYYNEEFQIQYHESRSLIRFYSENFEYVTTGSFSAGSYMRTSPLSQKTRPTYNNTSLGAVDIEVLSQYLSDSEDVAKTRAWYHDYREESNIHLFCPWHKIYSLDADYNILTEFDFPSYCADPAPPTGAYGERCTSAKEYPKTMISTAVLRAFNSTQLLDQQVNIGISPDSNKHHLLYKNHTVVGCIMGLSLRFNPETQDKLDACIEQHRNKQIA